MSDPAFDKNHAPAFGAYQASDPAFDRAFANEEPDVQGHAFESPDGTAAQPEAYAAVSESDIEVEGHQQKAYQESVDTADEANEVAEVEGHLHPLMMEDYAQGRGADVERKMIRAAQIREAKSASRDGGLLDKVLRRKEK